MKKIIISMLALSALVFTSCGDDPVPAPPVVEVVAPATYKFEKDGKSTVSFSGQVARLKMADELKTALGKDGLSTSTLASLNKMFAEGTGFADATLDATGKKLRGTVASATYSKLSSVESEALRTKMDGWIKEHVEVVIPAKDNDASAGVAGNLEGKRYVNAKGLEANQAVAKTMIGAVMLDQIVNKYVSQEFIDGAKEGNDKGDSYKEGKNYTKLEHGWDEAYGYVFGEVGGKKAFLGKYLSKVDNHVAGKDLYNNVEAAFRLGRAAIVAKRYDVVNQQAEIIRGSLSKLIAVKLVHYLLKGKGTKDASTLHALSEAYGFGHAMYFAHVTGLGQAGVASLKEAIDTLEGGENGLWSISDAALDALATKLAGYYGFKPEDAK